MSQAVA